MPYFPSQLEPRRPQARPRLCFVTPRKYKSMEKHNLTSLHHISWLKFVFIRKDFPSINNKFTYSSILCKLIGEQDTDHTEQVNLLGDQTTYIHCSLISLFAECFEVCGQLFTAQPYITELNAAYRRRIQMNGKTHFRRFPQHCCIYRNSATKTNCFLVAILQD